MTTCATAAAPSDCAGEEGVHGLPYRNIARCIDDISAAEDALVHSLTVRTHPT